MKKFFALFLSVILLFTSIPASTFANLEASDEVRDFSVEVIEDSSELTELLVKQVDIENESLTIKISKNQKENTFESFVTIDKEVHPFQSYFIEKLDKKFDAQEFATTLEEVLDGKEDSDYLVKYYKKVFKLKYKNKDKNSSSAEISDELLTKSTPIPQDGTVSAASVSAQAFWFIPLAIGALDATAAAALANAAVNILGIGAVIYVDDVLQERINTSNKENAVQETGTTATNWADFTSYADAITTSATKHMTLSAVQTIANRIKNDDNNDMDVRVYMSTHEKDTVMIVANITSSLTTTVNRHLANYVGGTKKDSSYRDETLNLNGYTVFLLYDHSSEKIFHAHFVRSSDRIRETTYMRYNNNLDLQIFPSVIYTRKYNYYAARNETERLESEKFHINARNNRNLLEDSKGKPSVVRYK
ncbi:hypothetical protein [Cytobacillus sp. IB215316]|uniref:hypothetical protein n=1 Tax=Cytobacillus sp. IB215316 TaxID=3097354 RepID=UPI002A10F863|nr:hypothetical protein [Cytobacillus sp. IB215316]MDX8359843.1 hypothetical protein [Cytobacillus sp. IB215316]